MLSTELQENRNFSPLMLEEPIMETALEMKYKLTNEKETNVSSQIIVEFAREENKNSLSKMVLDWLKSDFIKKGKSGIHFWHNNDIIAQAFNDCEALVALNSQKEIVGYMVWNIYDEMAAEINIVEVKEQYRRRGVFKIMLEELSKNFPDVYALSATVLSQSEKIFAKAGWKAIGKKYIKIIKAGLDAVNNLPDGQVIAVCSIDFYKFKAEPEKHRGLIKYYKINLDGKNKLRQPIITNHHTDGYIGIYANKKLIAEGKAKYLFMEGYYIKAECLIITRIIPEDTYDLKDFFAAPSKKAVEQESFSGQKRKNESSSEEQEKLNKKPLLFSSTPLELNITHNVGLSPETSEVGSSLLGAQAKNPQK